MVQNVQLALLLLPRLAVHLNRAFLQQVNVNVLPAANDVRRAQTRLRVRSAVYTNAGSGVVKNVLEPDHFQQSITAAEIVAISAKRQTASSVVGNVQTRHIHSVAHVILLPINEQPNTVLQHRRTWLQRLATAHDGVPQFVDHLRVEEGWIALAHRVESERDGRVDAEREIAVENALLCIIGGNFGMTESCFFRPDLICSVHRSNSVRCAVITC